MRLTTCSVLCGGKYGTYFYDSLHQGFQTLILKKGPYLVAGRTSTTKISGIPNRLYYRGIVDTFAKLLRATTSFVMSAFPFRPLGRTLLPMDKFHEIYVSVFFENYRENSSFIKIWQELRVLYTNSNIHFWSYLVQFLLECKMFQTKFVKIIKTHIVCSSSSRKSHRLWDNVGGKMVQPDGPSMTNMVHAW
jgi:hypothetical protein